MAQPPVPLPSEKGTAEKVLKGLLPESQGQNLALTVLCLPCSLAAIAVQICQHGEREDNESKSRVGEGGS